MAMTTALLSAAGTVLYALLGEPRNLQVQEVPVELPGWAADVAPARVVLLADLHASRTDGAWVDEQVRTVIALKPEAVILLGDYHKGANDARNMPMTELARRLAPLREHCPVYYILGNHDRYARANRVKQPFNQQGFTCVETEDAQLQFANGCRALLRGFRFRLEQLPPGPQRKRFAPQAMPADQPLIVAAHSPMHFMRYELGGELVVSGHTHGGQVCWPGGKPVYSPGIWSADMLQAGLHPGKTEGQQIYITRGTGTSSFPVRIFCPPELTLLLLKGSTQTLDRSK